MMRCIALPRERAGGRPFLTATLPRFAPGPRLRVSVPRGPSATPQARRVSVRFGHFKFKLGTMVERPWYRYPSLL
jgi:hypothetical protein